MLAAVSELGTVHPKQLEARFGKRRVTNAWGVASQATTRALEQLVCRGLLRVARREQGIRVYQVATPSSEPVPVRERLRALVLAVAEVLAPVDERTLTSIAARLARALPKAPAPQVSFRELCAIGALVTAKGDGATYAWPAERVRRAAAPRAVRLLAPFDPVVWDRRRFEHRFGYRFEAYTPAVLRVRGSRGSSSSAERAGRLRSDRRRCYCPTST